MARRITLTGRSTGPIVDCRLEPLGLDGRQRWGFEVAGQHFTVTVGRYADGTIGEIFLQSHKPGSQSDANARHAAVAASLAIQLGCALEPRSPALRRDSLGWPWTPPGAVVDVITAAEAANDRR